MVLLGPAILIPVLSGLVLENTSLIYLILVIPGCSFYNFALPFMSIKSLLDQLAHE